MDSAPAADALKSSFQSIPLDKIRPSPHQARKAFDEESLKGLAESIKMEGLLQPVMVRPAGDAYELISGERRVRAARLLGWHTVDAKVIQTASEGEAAAKGMIENLQREDLNPIEEAEGFSELNGLDPKYWTQAQIGRTIGRSESFISRSLDLLRLPDPIKDDLRYRKFTRSHALELVRLPNSDQQLEVARKIPGHLTCEETRKLVDSMIGGKGKAKRKMAETGGAKALPDPLAEFWLKFTMDPAIAPAGSWGVDYGPHPLPGAGKGKPPASVNAWTFWVAAPGLAPKADLARWFRNMANIFSDTSVEEAKTQADMERLTPPSEAAFERLEEEQKNLRVPGTPEEEAELEALARQGPAAVYAWIFGPKSSMAAKMRSATWESMGITDPAAGCRELVEALRNVRE